MRQHTLIFDTDLTEEDLRHYENTPGVTGVAAYQNVLILYYQHPVGEHETEALKAAINTQARTGGALLREGQLVA